VSSLRLIVLMFMTQLFAYATAQTPEGYVPYQRQFSMQTTASIVDNLSLTTIRDVNLNDPATVDGFITIVPNTSSFSGLMRINGRPGKLVRITYLSSETLLDQNGSGGVIKANYRISGFESDNQAASVLLDVGEANVRIGKDGVYFIWLGARLDLNRALPGVYVSEFIIELEGN